MASDAASDAAASVGFDSIEDFFSFVEEQESSPVPTPDKDLTCVSDASDTHCIIHSLDGYHAALKKTIHSPESQCKPGLFTLSQPLHNLNIDSRPHHPASLGQGIVTFQAGAEHTEFGYGSQGVKFPKDSHPLYRETQGEQAHETGMKTGSVAMMWDAGSLNMDFLNNVRNDPQGVGCCGVHSLANCACVILGAYGLESFKSTDGGLVSGSCKGNVWNTLFEYNRSAVEDVVGQKFKPYLVNETKAKVMNENVTAFELMKDTFPQVFNEGQKCDSGNHACPCQNLTHPPWWNGESESGKALLEAAKHWFNGVEQGPNQDSWTNAFVDNEESHSVFAMHRKVVGTLFPGGLGNGTSKDRANNASNLMNTVKISMFEELAKPDADGRVALCQSPLAVRAYTWVMLDANKANHGNGDLSDGGGDWVVPMNPNLEKLLSEKSPILGHQMAVLPMMDNEP